MLIAVQLEEKRKASKQERNRKRERKKKEGKESKKEREGKEEIKGGKEGKKNDSQVPLGGDGIVPGNRKHWERVKLAVGKP